jgi:hypothetical protein
MKSHDLMGESSMVDTNQIHRILKNNYRIDGEIHIDSQTGAVTCSGDVKLLTLTPSLLINWDGVNGNFSCGLAGLTSLKGAPHTVGGNFSCIENKLTSLEHAPSIVYGGFDCSSNQLTSLQGSPCTTGSIYNCSLNPLTSLQGLPNKMIGKGMMLLPWNDTLPLLRVLLVKGIHWLNIEAKECRDIMDKYLGKGYAGMVPCARELIKAGFKGNARL